MTRREGEEKEGIKGGGCRGVKKEIDEAAPKLVRSSEGHV